MTQQLPSETIDKLVSSLEDVYKKAHNGEVDTFDNMAKWLNASETADDSVEKWIEILDDLIENPEWHGESDYDYRNN